MSMSKFVNICNDFFKIDDIKCVITNVNKENPELYDVSVYFYEPIMCDDVMHYNYFYSKLTIEQLKNIYHEIHK